MIPWWSAPLFMAMGACVAFVVIALVSANDDER